MIDPSRVLQPLNEASGAINKLDEYQNPSELAAALRQVLDAIDRTLRLMLRADTVTPDELRLTALSPQDLSTENVVAALRQQNRVSLELGGMTHELARASERISRGEVRAGDADLARRTTEKLRADVYAASEAPVRDVAHSAVAAGVLEDAPERVPPPRKRRHVWWIAGIGVLVALAVGVWFASDTLVAGNRMKNAVTAFNSGRMGVAESGFRTVLSHEPRNVSAMLYLGRILRSEGRHQEAAEILRRAANVQPEDGDVRREIGSLFMDLNQPSLAAEQFRLAVNAQPAEKLNWIGLVRALRAAGNMEAAESILRKAPPDAQAALSQ